MATLRSKGALLPDTFQLANLGDAIMHLRSRTGAIVLIVVGTLFLLSNLGVVPQLGPLLRQWWPLILIAIGVIMLVQRS